MPTEIDPDEDEQLTGDDSSNENHGLSEDDLSRKNTRDDDDNDNSNQNNQSSQPKQQKDKKEGSSLKDKVQRARRLHKRIKQFKNGGRGGGGGGEKTAGKKASRQAGQLASKAAKQLGKQTGKQVVGLLREPHVALIVLGILLIIVIFFVVVFLIMNAARAAQENADEGPKLTLQKTGPTTAKAGDILTYTISASYPGTYSELTLVDTIPAGTQFVDVQAGQKATYNPANRTVTWKASENNASNSAQPVSFTLRLRATVDSSWIVNVLNGTAIGSGGTAIGGAPDLNQTTFKGLLTGQGRNTTILGDENKFVETVVKNAPGGSNLSTKQDQVKQIYRAAVAQKVNPLLILSIWGVESGWNTGSGNVFGCTFADDKTWAGQLKCVVNTANKRMAEFEKSAATKKPVLLPIEPQPAQCTYTDPFMYAFERMTPVCSMDDGNICARQNFVSYFKTYMGTKTFVQCNATRDKAKYSTKEWRGIDP